MTSNAAPGTAEALIGVRLADRYQIKSVIARGAMGTVYVAEQHPLDRKVAVKVLHAPIDADDAELFMERFHREAATLAKLQHPNTVRVYDFGHWGGLTYLVMEYIDGFSLRRLQAAGPIPPARAINIAKQICDALQEAHSLGLIHRDLKPANVLVTRHAGALDVVKVVDFGLAKGFFSDQSELTAAGQVLGTPMYMSPEQIRGDPCDPRSDIYSLGVLLYRSLTGQTPFPKGTTATMLMANLYDRPKPFEVVAPSVDVPPALEYTVMRCLEKEPKDRFASVLEVRKALKACLAAVVDPSRRWLELTVEDGYTMLPDDISEIAPSSLSTSTVPSRVLMPSQPAAATISTPVIEPERRNMPEWVLAVGFAVVVLVAVLAGAAAQRAFNSSQTTAVSAPQDVPAASARE